MIRLCFQLSSRPITKTPMRNNKTLRRVAANIAAERRPESRDSDCAIDEPIMNANLNGGTLDWDANFPGQCDEIRSSKALSLFLFAYILTINVREILKSTREKLKSTREILKSTREIHFHKIN